MRPEKIQTVALSRGFDSRHLHELPKVVHLTSANAVRRVPAGIPRVATSFEEACPD
jgi:hypothetical protein